MRYVYFKHGVPQYVELKVDFSFVEVALKGELPRLDFSCLRDKNVEGFDDIEPLLSSINLEAFSFTGISILRFVDCNREQVFNRVQQIVADLSRFEKQSFHRDVSSILSTMVGTTAISHSFFSCFGVKWLSYPEVRFSERQYLFWRIDIEGTRKMSEWNF